MWDVKGARGGYSLSRPPRVCRRRGADVRILLRHSRNVSKTFFLLKSSPLPISPFFCKNIFQLKFGQALIFVFFPWWVCCFIFQSRRTAHKCLNTTWSYMALCFARGSEPSSSSPVDPTYSPGHQLSYLVSANMMFARLCFTEAIFWTYTDERVCGSTSLTSGSFIHMKQSTIMLHVFKCCSEHIASAPRTVPGIFDNSVSASHKITYCVYSFSLHEPSHISLKLLSCIVRLQAHLSWEHAFMIYTMKRKGFCFLKSPDLCSA